MTRLSAAQAPELATLTGAFYEDCADDCLDPDVCLESAMRDILRVDGRAGLDRLVEQVRGVLAAAASEVGPAAAFASEEDWILGLLPTVPVLPAGAGYGAWLRYVLRYVPQFAAAPFEGGAEDRAKTVQQRFSRFTNDAVEQEAVAEALRLHEEAVETWLHEPFGSSRFVVFAELGREVGRVVRDVAWGRPEGAPSTSATAVVVVLRAEPGATRANLMAAYPEIALPGGPRARHPDLLNFFGGYFGQARGALAPGLWGAERAFNTEEPDVVRERVAAQLWALLAEGWEGLPAAVEGLGSYVSPIDVRRWVIGLHRRMTWVQWRLPDR